LARLGEQGHIGVLAAVTEDQKRFTAEVRPDRKDGSEVSEYERAINGAIAKVMATPTAEENRGCCGDPRKASDTDRRKTLPAAFWDARPILKHIQQAAHSRGRCPDVALYAVLARVSSQVSPDCNSNPASDHAP
jgi:hypothetical protein